MSSDPADPAFDITETHAYHTWSDLVDGYVRGLTGQEFTLADMNTVGLSDLFEDGDTPRQAALRLLDESHLPHDNR